MTVTLEILQTGPLALVEDLGRAGLSHLGVTRSGAADRRSHTLANRLVANPGDRATVEVTMGGFTARVHGGDGDGIAIAVTGADTDPSADGVPFGANSIHYVHDGEVISLNPPRSGGGDKSAKPKPEAAPKTEPAQEDVRSPLQKLVDRFK